MFAENVIDFFLFCCGSSFLIVIFFSYSVSFFIMRFFFISSLVIFVRVLLSFDRIFLASWVCFFLFLVVFERAVFAASFSFSERDRFWSSMIFELMLEKFVVRLLWRFCSVFCRKILELSFVINFIMLNKILWKNIINKILKWFRLNLLVSFEWFFFLEY